MADAISLNAESRTTTGKGDARKVRAKGLVPGILYAGGKDATPIAVNPKELTKALMGPLRRNVVLEVSVKGGAKRHAMVREIQIHPVKRLAIHIDLVEVDPKKPVTVKVPFDAFGKSAAIVAGAKLQLVVRTLNVSVAPNNIPEKITLDVTDAGFGVVRAKEIKMPAGVKLLDHPETPVVSLRMPRGEKEDAVAAPAAGAAAAAGAAPAAGAAAAAGAAPAADAKGGKKK